MTIRVLHGDCRDVLPTLDAGSVQCCVTSPPYYGLRDYGVAGQIGLEASPDEYVAQMVAVFREVRRVLRDDGTCWLNLGDSYAMTTRGAGGQGKQQTNAGSVMADRSWHVPQGIKPKDLLGIPWMVAFALRADGWYLRRDIIWAKRNPMPESVTDRPTSAHEYVFLLSKRANYFYDADAIAEPFADARMGNPGSYKRTASAAKGTNNDRRDGGFLTKGGGWNADGGVATRNARSVWTIATQPSSLAHFAMMPTDLAERCIKAGTSERGACPQCGAPWSRDLVFSKDDRVPYRTVGTGPKAAVSRSDGNNGFNKVLRADGSGGDLAKRLRSTVGWSPSCSCPEHAPAPCVVLDPFGGAGTTGLVADRLGRNATLIELSPSNSTLSADRIRGDAPLFAEIL